MKNVHKDFVKRTLLCLAVLPVGCAVLTCSGGAHRFEFDADGSFVFLHVTDVQENRKLAEGSDMVLRTAIETYKPRLIVLTGDNVNSMNEKGGFETTIAPFIQVMKDTKTPFCVTFGNHDSEKKGDNRYTRQEQYDIYKREGGALFVDHDVPELSGVGSGVIGIWEKGAGAAAFNLFVMDSGDYAPGGYGGCFGDQIGWYERVSGSTPCLWFQHIIVPDANGNGLFENGKLAPGVLGEFNEPTCPTTTKAYTDSDHTFKGRTLYQSWQKTGNLKGAYFGHDHKNSFDGTDKNGIRIGMTKALTLCSYNDGNPGLRVFTIHPDGTYVTRLSTLRHP